MPKQKRYKTKYPGVSYLDGTSIKGKPERVYYIRYRKDGKQVEEPAGRQSKDDMTPAKANNIRAERIKGHRKSNREKREALLAEKIAKDEKWTIDRLWNSYKGTRIPGKSLNTDKGRYGKYLKERFGKKAPEELNPLDVDRLRISLLKKLAPQTVKHVLNLLTWVINYGVKSGLCKGIPFHIKKPTVDNVKTEYLTEKQIISLLAAIEKDSNTQVANLMKLALFTGMRRGELLNLRWKDIDFDRGFITLKDTKGGKDQAIPMNDTARDVLNFHPKGDGVYVFPGSSGGKRATVDVAVNKIKKAAGLPKDFRPLHGLRHSYASMLASSGKVDIYTLQRLLTHKDPRMTQRYAFLRDEALKRASGLAGDIINNMIKENEKKISDLKKVSTQSSH